VPVLIPVSYRLCPDIEATFCVVMMSSRSAGLAVLPA